MNKFICFFIAFLFAVVTYGQNALRIVARHDNEMLPGASVTIRELNRLAVSDSSGLAVFRDLPAGKYTIVVTHIGFETLRRQVRLPLPADQVMEFELTREEEEEEEEVIIYSTRTSRTIRNIPTRVETIAGEEVDEKSNMRPSNVTMLLHESTGIQMQQTSATSATSSIRIQGLDGRYTQILKNSFPSFGGFSGSLSVLEIPPLDLQQVEIIKGPASTLYGGGAIAGVVNFITVEPGRNDYAKFLVNQSHIGQTNLAGFFVDRAGKIGFTGLATANRQLAYDVDEDGFTELPRSLDFTFSPKLFIYPNENTRLIIGHTLTTGDRRGGDIEVVNGNADASHIYFENNKTLRNISTLEFHRKFRERHQLSARQSLNLFDRTINIPQYGFRGVQTNAYTDLSYSTQYNRHLFISGLNFIFDRFNEDRDYSGVERNEKNITAGAYVQDTWDPSDKLAFENGLRIDVTDHYGVFILPRVSVLYRISGSWSSRISGGMGYKLPSLFTEETEAMQFRNVSGPENFLVAEKSYGATADINFRSSDIEGLEISLNHMFYYTTIRRPIILQSNTSGFHFVNAQDPTISYGFETNLKLIYEHVWKLFAGYTMTEARAKWRTAGNFLPLVPKGKLNLALIYEKHDFLKIGLEGYLTGKQYLSNNEQTPSFWEFGLMVEKPVGKFSFYLNFENFTDERQSKYKPVVSGPHDDPSFAEIWNHTEGLLVNGGVKLRF